MKKAVLSGFAVLGASFALAGEVDVPNQFQAGASAVAAEVNDNFAAVEAAVDDNAQSIHANAEGVDANAQTIATLQDGLATAGIAVRIDGVAVGRYSGHGAPAIEVDIAPSTGIGGTVSVAETANLSTSGRINAISPTGYRFSVATSDFEDAPRLSEGQLGHAPIFFDDATCTGGMYFPVEGDTGWFSTFDPGSGGLRPVKHWSFRQGVVFASPDPNDVTPVYMIRRGQTAQTVPLLSLLVWAEPLQQPFCVDAGNIPGFDVTDPNHVNNSAFAVEPADVVETGVSGTLGGQITVGL